MAGEPIRIRKSTRREHDRQHGGKAQGAADRERAARRSAEAALRESEQRLRETFEQAAVGITRVDLDGVLVDVNEKFCEMLGYSRRELLGRHVRDITHPGDYGQGARYRSELAHRAVKSASGEKRFIRKDGTVMWARRTMSTACDDSGKPLYVISVVEDITERKMLERRFELAFNQAAVGMTQSGLDGRLLQVNQKYADMLGYTRDELVGMRIEDLTHPEDRADSVRAMRRLRDKEVESVSSEKRLLRRDGSVIWVNRTSSLVQDVSGEPLHFLAVIEDITQRKEFETERARLATIVESSEDAIVSRTLAGTILTWNAGAERLFGWSAAEAIGANISLFIPPGHEADLHRRTTILGGGERVASFDTVRRRKDGRLVDVSLSQAPVRNERGEVIGVSSIFRDITARKQIETERAQLAAIVEGSEDAIVSTALDRKVLSWNAAAERMFGYTAAEVVGRVVSFLIPPDREAEAAQRRKLMDPSRPMPAYDTVRVARDGRRLDVSVTQSPIKDSGGRVIGVSLVFRDITLRTQADRRLAMEHAVTSALAEAASIREALPRIIRTICEGLDWICGFHWSWDRPAEVLRCQEHWYRDAAGVETFVRASLNMVNEAPSVVTAAKPGGLVRQVWVTGAPVWISDVMRAADFRRAPAADQAGLHSAFAFPVLSEGRPVGVIEFFSHEIRQPDDALLQIMRAIGTQIGLFMQRKEAEQALRASEERYRDVFETSPLPMWVWDDETLAFVDVNRATVDHYGYTRDEFLRMNVRDIWAPGDDRTYDQHIRGRAHRQALALQRKHRTRDGRVIDVEVTARRFTLGGRGVWLTLINDVTDRKRAEAALRESEEQFKQLANNIPQVFWITDIGHRETIYVSPAADAMTGCSLQEIYASPRALIRAVHPADRRRVYEARKSAASGGYDQTYRVVRPDGTIRWVNDRAFPVSDETGRTYRIAGIAEDVTDRKLAEERLLQLAHYDTLTSLPNRVLFYDRLKQVLAQAKRNQWIVGVLFVDLDRFKNVNDTLGHAVGDELLQQVSERLTRSVRSGDTVGRLGGDEFAIVLSSLSSSQDANLVAQKIMTSFAEPFKLGGSEIYVTASIGITLYPDDSSDQDTLIRNADSAMYRAKEMGRNSFQFYTPEMNSRALEILNMESSLRRALDRDEFLLYYQPMASVADGRVVGVEALLRWQHPERGLVSPGDFMFVMEETGLIVPVGEWVLRRVCLQIKEWERAGIPLVPVSVNLSARQFSQKDFGPGIGRLLDAQSVDPALIELEITESSIMANTEEAARTLEYLSELGVGLSIDDFGTGYSSLAYLKRFPLDRLKIDRSFIRDLTTDNDDATITRAVISMAHSLGLKVIAEGVETGAQHEFLAEHGCDEVQGYFFSRPMPAADCGAWLAEGRRLLGAKPPAAPGVPSVLLVDDDDDALMLLKHTLDREGYRILLARNAAEAIDAVNRQRVDLVIADQHMAGMSGAELLRHIKMAHPDTVRMMTSMHTDIKTITDAMSRGEVFRFLPKEYTPDQTRANVREALLARRGPPAAATRPE
jgi:diguanylate cyclase (GGDEF)-like protein/PAS domain S-box-containing protein